MQTGLQPSVTQLSLPNKHGTPPLHNHLAPESGGKSQVRRFTLSQMSRLNGTAHRRITGSLTGIPLAVCVQERNPIIS